MLKTDNIPMHAECMLAHTGTCLHAAKHLFQCAGAGLGARSIYGSKLQFYNFSCGAPNSQRLLHNRHSDNEVAIVAAGHV